MNIKRIGVVGCGVMGSGIVFTCAKHGYEVLVSEANAQIQERRLSDLFCTINRQAENGKISSAEKQFMRTHITGITRLGDLADCDLIIEAIVEDLEQKKIVFTEISALCKTSSILATNTSCLSVEALAATSSRPEKVIGIHFFNPAPIVPLIEIVPSTITSEETVNIASAFSKSLGKSVIYAKDTPGFIVNKLLIPFILNAVRMLENGIATREDIDMAVNLGLYHPMGPLALADMIGIDVVFLIADTLFSELKDPQYEPPVLLKNMLSSGCLGKKNGKGFYNYNAVPVKEYLKS
jgi:3-hydroxybutyryl-CoA dehydrogenase